MDWAVRGSNPGGGEIFRNRPDWPRGPPSLPYNGYRVYYPGVKRLECDANHPPPHPPPPPGSGMGRAILQSPFYACLACSGTVFTFYCGNLWGSGCHSSQKQILSHHFCPQLVHAHSEQDDNSDLLALYMTSYANTLYSPADIIPLLQKKNPVPDC